MQHWRVDLTHVVTYHNNREQPPEPPVFEVEFEFSDEVVELSKQKEKEGLEKIATAFWEFFFHLFAKLQFSADSHYFQDIKFQKVLTLLTLMLTHVTGA